MLETERSTQIADIHPNGLRNIQKAVERFNPVEIPDLGTPTISELATFPKPIVRLAAYEVGVSQDSLNEILHLSETGAGRHMDGVLSLDRPIDRDHKDVPLSKFVPGSEDHAENTASRMDAGRYENIVREALTDEEWAVLKYKTEGVEPRFIQRTLGLSREQFNRIFSRATRKAKNALFQSKYRPTNVEY